MVALRPKLTKENLFAYTWNETTHNKGSNEIISAVHHFLTNLDIKEEINVLRIVADGCSGQNKNSSMVAMLGKWLTTAYQVIPKKAKITDVSNLLKKHCGEQWRDMHTLAFYKTVEDRKSYEQGDIDEDTAEIPSDLCEDGFDDVNLIV